MRIVVLGSYAPSLVRFRGPLMQYLVHMGDGTIRSPQKDFCFVK